jgi:carboxyl-terminal processing protease
MSEERRAGFIQGLIGGAVAALAGVALAVMVTDSDDPGSLSDQARDVIEDNYFEEVSGDELEQGSVRGMVDELRRRFDDRFSHYFDPEQFAEFNTTTSGEFSGVGLTVNEVPRGLRIAEVLPDSPAEEADLAVGDVITAVDGKSIAGVASEVATGRIKGEPGTEVELTVEPVSGAGERTVTVERAQVRLPVTDGRIERVDGHEVAYVPYFGFSRGAHGELRTEIERLYREGAEGLILDLRGNGGGLLQEAVLSASIFVEEGDVVTTRSRTRGEKVYDATGGALDPRPTVVLINRDTASAAEILAAAISSYDLGTIVGERSFGKGTFQEVIGLPDGGALDLTIGEYFTADDVSLAEKGIKPHVRAVDDLKTRPDEALDEALTTLAPELP